MDPPVMTNIYVKQAKCANPCTLILTQQMLLALPLREEKLWLTDLTSASPLVSVSTSALKTSLPVSVSFELTIKM